MRTSTSTSAFLRLCLPLLLVVGLLSGIGVLFVHSTTGVDQSFPNASARSQILKLVVAIIGCVVVARQDYRFFERYAYVIYTAIIAVLVVMVGVKVASGSALNRFINLGVFQIQPSELMKVALILALARYLRYREDQRSVSGLVYPFFLTLLPMGLVLLQPDMGTSLMLPPILLGMLLVAGSRRWHLAAVLLAGGLLLPTVYLLGERVPLLRDSSWTRYQQHRITAWLNRDRVTNTGHGHQLDQSLIAIGSGGPLGKGYNQGPQNRDLFLPEKDTDFIFSIVAEEWGFVGASTVVLAQLALSLLLLRIAMATREPFGRLLTSGMAVAFAAQSVQNLGMTVGLTPITGVPLPFVSLGGSSLLTSYLAIGLACGVACRPLRVVASRDLCPTERRRPVLLREDRPAGQLQRVWPVE